MSDIVLVLTWQCNWCKLEELVPHDEDPEEACPNCGHKHASVVGRSYYRNTDEPV